MDVVSGARSKQITSGTKGALMTEGLKIAWDPLFSPSDRRPLNDVCKVSRDSSKKLLAVFIR